MVVAVVLEPSSVVMVERVLALVKGLVEEAEEGLHVVLVLQHVGVVLIVLVVAFCF